MNSSERMIPESASREPTERSIPPVSTTNVIPIETTNRIELPVRRFSMFACEKKSGWVSEKKTKIPTSSTSTTAKRLAAVQMPAARSTIAWRSGSRT